MATGLYTTIGGASTTEAPGTLDNAAATKLAAQVQATLEDVRQTLAYAYVRAEGGTVIEHEVGECLAQVRKSLVRVRKAIGELAQAPLGLE